MIILFFVQFFKDQRRVTKKHVLSGKVFARARACVCISDTHTHPHAYTHIHTFTHTHT